MPPTKRFLWSALLVAAATLLIPAVVIAAHYIIDTDDGNIDADWPAVSATLFDGDDYADDDFDIARVWVTNAGNYAYFRATLVGSGGFGYSQDNYIVANLDCNRNGVNTDAQDILVFYSPNMDLAFECQGNDQPGCFSAEDNGGTYGEEIAVFPTNYEWMAATTGSVNWVNCASNIDVWFSTYDYLNEIEHDVTPAFTYNVPTVVSLSEFSATGFSPATAWLLLGIGLAGVALLGLSLRRLRLSARSIQNDTDH
jgi:hypothetical protein